MTRVEIAGVRPCDCPSHARVVLFDSERQRRLQVRIHAQAGEALTASFAGLRSHVSTVIEMMRDALDAGGASIEAVTIRCDGGDLHARMRVRGPLSSRDIDVEPCEALLAAYQLQIPLFVDEDVSIAAHIGVPDVYHRAFEARWLCFAATPETRPHRRGA